MSFARFDDGVLDHPKMEHAEELFPDFAWVLWSRALVYVNKHKLDGKVPRRALAKFIRSRKPKPVDVAEALVTAGLWENDGDDYRFHDFRSWNLTREEREDAAKKNREKQADYRERQRAVTGSKQPHKQEANQNVTGYAGLGNQVTPEPVTANVTGDTLPRAGAPACAPSEPSQASPSQAEQGLAHAARPGREKLSDATNPKPAPASNGAPLGAKEAQLLVALTTWPTLALIAHADEAREVWTNGSIAGRTLDDMLAGIAALGEKHSGTTTPEALHSRLMGFIKSESERRRAGGGNPGGKSIQQLREEAPSIASQMPFIVAPRPTK